MKKISRRSFLQITAAGAAAAALSACGAASSAAASAASASAPASSAAAASASPTGTITVLSFSEYHDAIQASIDAYMKAYPDVTVKLEEYPYSQYNDAVSIKLGSGDSGFDVVLTDATMVSNYAYKGWIAPVDEYFTDDDKSQFAEALVKSGTYDGSFYSAPLCNSCQVLWYNKALLDKAGIEYPSEDPTQRLSWEKVVELGQSVIAAAKDSSVFGLTFEQVDRPYQILPLPNSMGADAFSADGKTVDGYLNSDNFQKAMQWYSDIHNVSCIAPKGTSPSDSVGLFTAGKIAFMCANIFDFGTFSKTDGLQFGFTAFPYFTDGKPASPTDSWHVSLSSFSKNVGTAVDFIKYFTMGDGNDTFLTTKGAFAARTKVLESYSTDSAYSEFPKTVFKLAAYEAQNTAYPRPITLAYGEFETIIDSTFSDIRNGSDVAEALNSAVSQMQTQMSMYD